MTTKEEGMHRVWMIALGLFLGALPLVAQEVPVVPLDLEQYNRGGTGDIDSTLEQLEQQVLESSSALGNGAAVTEETTGFWYDEARREAVRRAIESANK